MAAMHLANQSKRSLAIGEGPYMVLSALRPVKSELRIRFAS